MRPRCIHCNRFKAIKGTGYCRRHQARKREVDAHWHGLMGYLRDCYERETGEIQVAGSEGWIRWLDHRVFKA